MIDLWTQPREVRHSVRRKMRQLEKNIGMHADQIARIEPWLANLKRMKAEDEKELAKIKETYKLEP